MSETAIVPLNQEIVEFYGDEIPVAKTSEGKLYVPLRQLATFLGLSISSQRQRVMADRVLANEVRNIVMVGADGKRYETLCLPLDKVTGWLFSINTNRVRVDLQDKLDRYRAECFDVLWRHFQGEILPAAAESNMTPAEQAVETARALLRLAEQQLAFERELEKHERAIQEVAGKQEIMAKYMRGFIEDTRGRLTSLELELASAPLITEAQATEVQLAVKTLAALLQQQGGANGHQRVYAELYRRYGISSYRQLPRECYEDVMTWLHSWYNELSGDNG